ncbi:hypothetical protein NKR23_g5077 [Pleurostoma richardsiae]|uniref:Flavin reductase like domain-containing protein n=1 Tax=Pleurostoma richardsiae TaxID=41990 RepID=A0AA38RH53_9PEZI|nr:hypothetical protein NKR23_g5077 [Pleurostoma richardsiae]
MTSAGELASGWKASFNGGQRRTFRLSSPHNKQWKTAPAVPPSVHPHSSTTETALTLPEQLRGLMRLLTHSVVVCTSRGGESAAGDYVASSFPDQQPAPRAMTMSSFTSLTLHPTPLVSFNVATPSRTLDAVAASGLFNIHVLAGDPAGARVAEWFRRGNAEPMHVFDRIGECGCEVMPPQPDQDSTGADGEGEEEPVLPPPPLLRGPGIMYAMRCRLLREEPCGGLVRVRDHVIVLGEVLEILEGQRRDEESGEERFGLAYADRRYRQLGNIMVGEGGEA